MRQARIAASVLVGLGLVSGPASVTWAQARVVVPVIIQSPRVASPRASSVQITTQTLPAAPGGTSTRVTVQDTTGRLLGAAPLPRAGTQASEAPTTRVTVRDTTGRVLGMTPAGAGSAVPGVTSTRITVQDTTGRLLGTVPGTRALAPATTSSVVVELDRQGTAGPGGSSGAIGFGRRSWTVTTDGPPIEVPIIILAD